MFNGDDPTRWISGAKIHFKVQETSEMVKELLECYGGMGEGSIYDQLTALKQIRSMDEYIGRFKCLIAQIPKLHDEQYFLYVTHGLREEVQAKALVAEIEIQVEFQDEEEILESDDESETEEVDGVCSAISLFVLEKETQDASRTMKLREMIKGVPLIILIDSVITSFREERFSLQDADRVFDGALACHDMVTWNFMLGAYLMHEKEDFSFKDFIYMLNFGFKPDAYTYTRSFGACSAQEHKSNGKCVHRLVIKNGLEDFVPISNALIAMYIKFNDKGMEDALRISKMVALGTPFSQDMYKKMLGNLLKQLPKTTILWNSIIFGHDGLVEEGCNIMESMESDFGIPRRKEHYACAIDLYGRAGQLEKAKALVETMPFEVDAMVLKTLLGACRFCGDIELENISSTTQI
ncbi:putative pentatricopeptide repeat-containing protein At3g25970 [Vigna umbellata]|uniref:putative pentatricopeptide repeat-containing protein At3g25970 n=1 Tax=Vigna umbellata TaxID=87088 RepID=UPI001F5EAAC4|nr:putative pentatricopeptide repeat-containing protein At3g25970 [Vigna umbellata]